MNEEKTNLTPEQQAEIEEKVEKLIHEKKVQRTGARVFCIRCGAYRRTPLRKWKNVYICQNCWKIKNTIGEDEFIADILRANGKPLTAEEGEKLIDEEFKQKEKQGLNS